MIPGVSGVKHKNHTAASQKADLWLFDERAKIGGGGVNQNFEKQNCSERCGEGKREMFGRNFERNIWMTPQVVQLCLANFWHFLWPIVVLIYYVNEDSYFKMWTKYDFLKKVEKKFLDAVWQYWRYLEVSPDQGGHFLSLRFLIESPQKKFLHHKPEGYWKYEVLSKYSILILSFIFKKSELFSLFLTYNLIGVSYGHAVF